MRITDNQKVEIFKALASKPLYEVGLDFGLNEYYKKPASVKNAVYRIYKEVKMQPEKFNISSETVEVITGVVGNRIVASKEPVHPDSPEDFDFTTITTKTRDKALGILGKKLDRINASRSKIDKVSVGELAKVFGILFDKGQIIQGQATENIAMLSVHIKDDLSPDDAIGMVLKMREINNVKKEKLSK